MPLEQPAQIVSLSRLICKTRNYLIIIICIAYNYHDFKSESE